MRNLLCNDGHNCAEIKSLICKKTKDLKDEGEGYLCYDKGLKSFFLILRSGSRFSRSRFIGEKTAQNNHVTQRDENHYQSLNETPEMYFGVQALGERSSVGFAKSMVSL